MQIARLCLAAAVCLVFAMAGAMPAAAHSFSTAAAFLPSALDTDDQATDDADTPQLAPDPNEREPVLESTELLVALPTLADYAHIDPGRSIC
jgi:hypothetical protein